RGRQRARARSACPAPEQACATIGRRFRCLGPWGRSRPKQVAQIRGLGESLALAAAIDALADDGNGLMIDAGRVPALDRGVVGLAGLVARAAHPAMALEEI